MLQKLGKTFASLYAVGCGFSVAGVFIMLHVTGIALVVYPIVALLFIATAFTNYRMTRTVVPLILIDIFGKEKLFQGLFQKEDGNFVSNFRAFLIGGGIILALSVGGTFGALNYTGALMLGTLFSLGTASVIIPPVAIFFSVVVLIVMSSLMLYSITKIAKIDNLFKACVDVLIDLVNTDRNLERNRGKPDWRIKLERGFTVFLVVLFLPLSILGTVMTMHACTSSLGNLLLYIPHAIPTAVLYASNIIALGLALIGQLPFVVRTAVISANEACAKYQPEFFCENETLNTFLNILVMASRIVTAIGNGILALLGTHNHLAAGLGFVGSTANNFAAAANEPPPGPGGDVKPVPQLGVYPAPVNFYLPAALPGNPAKNPMEQQRDIVAPYPS